MQREKDGAIIVDNGLAEALNPASCDQQDEQTKTCTKPKATKEKVRWCSLSGLDHAKCRLTILPSLHAVCDMDTNMS